MSGKAFSCRSREIARRINSSNRLVNYSVGRLTGRRKNLIVILKRQIAKENKDYTNADQIREQLLKLDIILEDKPDKTIWRKS